MAYAIAEKIYLAEEGIGSAEELIETSGGVDAFMEQILPLDNIEVYNFDDEILKEYFRLRNERVEELRGVYILEPIDNLDLVVEEVLKLDKDINLFNYDYLDGTRNEPVYPTLTLEQQQRLGEKFPNLVVPSV